MGLLSRLPSSALQCLGRITRNSIGGTFTVGLLLFVLSSRRDILALVVVNVTPKFEVEIGLGSRSGRSSTVSS